MGIVKISDIMSGRAGIQGIKGKAGGVCIAAAITVFPANPYFAWQKKLQNLPVISCNGLSRFLIKQMDFLHIKDERMDFTNFRFFGCLQSSRYVSSGEGEIGVGFCT
jgi:hypothetical protein